MLLFLHVSYLCVNICIIEGVTPSQDCGTAGAGPRSASVSGFLLSLLSPVLAEQNPLVGCGGCDGAPPVKALSTRGIHDVAASSVC